MFRFYWKSTGVYNGEITLVERVEGGYWFSDLKTWKVLDRTAHGAFIMEYLEELSEDFIALPCWKQPAQEWKLIQKDSTASHWMIGDYEMLDCGCNTIPTWIVLPPEYASILKTFVLEHQQGQVDHLLQTPMHYKSDTTVHIAHPQKGYSHNQTLPQQSGRQREHLVGKVHGHQSNSQSSTQYPRKSSFHSSKSRMNTEQACLIQM